MTAREQAAAKDRPITQVPVALGGEGVVYNLSLPAGARLHLTAEPDLSPWRQQPGRAPVRPQMVTIQAGKSYLTPG